MQLAQHLGRDLGCVGAADPDRRPPVIGAQDLAVLRQVGRAVEQGDADRLGRRELVGQGGEGAVEQDPAVVDDDHPLAQGLDVGHVVARQQHRRARPLVVLGEERADPLLGGDVEPDRRLVEEQHRRPMQEGAADLGLHPLPERQVADRLGDQVAEVEELDQLVAHLHELGARQAVDGSDQLERVEGGQVPLELVPVAHHHRDPAQEVALALRRRVAQHPCLARRRVQQAGQHLERRGLAGAVGTEEADDLAGGDLEADPVDRLDLARLAPDEALGRRADAALAHRHVEGLAQLDRPHGDVGGADGADLGVGRGLPGILHGHWLSIWARCSRPL